jgi:hypothetical protein
MKETKYESYLSGKHVKGCKLCVKGEKMVLFVTGLCSRGCDFCPLSKMRKNIDNVYANERKVESINDLIEEVKISGAKGCSLTGGDPLLKMNRTIELASKLKKTFGKKFHIHIYVSTKMVTEDRLKRLSAVVDEIRFHPDFDKPLEQEIRKISLANKFWNKKNIGIEIPCFPDKGGEIIELIKKSEKYISFLNLNELEAGEFSEELMEKKYKISKEGYTIKDSIDAGKYIISKLERESPKLNIHLCTARLKNWYQYRNRLKNYKVPKFSKRTSEGTFIYFATPYSKDLEKNLPKNNFVLDKDKNRIILSPKAVLRLRGKIKIYKIEEYPTFEREEAEVEILE